MNKRAFILAFVLVYPQIGAPALWRPHHAFSIAHLSPQSSNQKIICSDSPLLLAIKKGDKTEVRRLLLAGADVGAWSCPEGRRALSESIVRGQTQIVRQLLEAGANPNLPDPTGVTPIMFAAFYCSEDSLVDLLKEKAKVDEVDKAGVSALMLASQDCPDGRITAILLANG